MITLAVPAMATLFEVVVDEAHRGAAELALEEIEYWHRRLNRFAADSLVSHLNRSVPGSAVRVDAATYALLLAAAEVCRASGGAFDITLGRGADALVLGELTAARADEDVAIDLGGIAKGHALDRAAAILREHGVARALLHGGTSSVLAIGGSWNVALGPGPAAEVVTLEDQALSVSSNHERAHVVDPRGIGPAEARLAAVIGPDATRADAWSTALLVLGERPESLGNEWTTILA